MADSPRRLLTRAEVGEWLNISISTVNRLLAAGAFDTERVGERGLRITSESVQKYLIGQRQIYTLKVTATAQSRVERREGGGA